MFESGGQEHISRVAGAMPHKLGVAWIATGLLFVVLVGALEIPDWLILVTNAPIPWLGHYFPYFAPVLVVALGFNLAATERLRGGRIPFVAETLLFVLFVAVLASIEFAHWLLGGGEPRPWLVLTWFWICVHFLVLRSFDHYLPRCRSLVVELVVGLALFVAVCDFLFAIVLAPGWGKAPLGLNAGQLFDSAYVAYLSVFAIALLLFERATLSMVGAAVKYGLLIPFLAYVAHQQRLAGPDLLMLALLALKSLSLLPRRNLSLRAFVAFAAVVAGAGLMVNFIFGIDDPTLKGLGKGLYFFDEVGQVHGDIMSSFARRETILAELRLFLDSPIFGVGMARAGAVKVLLSGMHSSLMYILVTAGLLGFGMLCLWLIWTAWGAVRRRGVGGLSLFLVMLAMMLLATEPVWWWSVLLFLTSPTSSLGDPRQIPGSMGSIQSGVTLDG